MLLVLAWEAWVAYLRGWCGWHASMCSMGGVDDVLAGLYVIIFAIVIIEILPPRKEF